MIAATRDAGLIVLGIILVLLALAAGHAIDTADERPTPALQDAQQAAAERAAWERAARAQCRSVYGPDAPIRETAEGHLVCSRPSTTTAPTQVARGML